MKEAMNDTGEHLEDDVVEEDDDLDDAEPSEADLADATVPPDPAAEGAEVESIQELIVKQEAEAEAEEVEEDEVVVPLTREEKLAEPLEARVVPIQATEFTCKRCFLVKHRGANWRTRRRCCAATAPEGALGTHSPLLIALASGLALSLAFPPAGWVAPRVRGSRAPAMDAGTRAAGTGVPPWASRSASASTAQRSTGSGGSGPWPGSR